METFVARQPILDERLALFGYELLFRPAADSRMAAGSLADGNAMSSRVILGALDDHGLDGLVGEHRAFINVTRELLLGDIETVLPVGHVVLEILESVKPDAEVVAAVSRLRRQGYLIALDDFIYDPSFEPLLALAHVVKLDVLGVSPSDLKAQVARLTPYKLTLLAERVETHEVFQNCKQLGFKLFQGYFFAKPQVVVGRKVSPSHGTAFRLLRLLNDDKTTAEQLEEVFEQDAALSYKLLRQVNSPLMGLRREIRSIREALILLGERHLRMWATLIVFGAVGGAKPSALLKAAQYRARLCQQLAAMLPGSPTTSAFTVGLFSLLDALLDQPLVELLTPLGLADELRQALLARMGTLGTLLSLAEAMERGDAQALAAAQTALRFSAEQTIEAHREALRWVDQLET